LVDQVNHHNIHSIAFRSDVFAERRTVGNIGLGNNKTSQQNHSYLTLYISEIVYHYQK